MSYCIYLRKSRADIEAEDRGEGETLARHEKILLELARSRKWNITQIHKEIVSGETISARPVMQQLLAEVEQGLWSGVLVMEVERLARGDTMDQGLVAHTFKYSGTKIITPMKTYDPNNEYDEEYFEFGLFMSRREYKTINRRLQHGRLQSVQEGKFLGSKPPYGYVRKKLEKQKGYTLEINPEQADVVRLVFELYTKGEKQPDGTTNRIGTFLIARKLNKLRIRPMNGDIWVPTTIQDMLHNPVYIGKIRWNSRPVKKKMTDGIMKKERPRAKEEDVILIDGLHDSIIDSDTWNLAQEYLALNLVRPVPSNRTIKNPLAGLIICGMCGRKMIRRPYTNNYQDTLMCPVASCKNVSSALNVVEKELLNALEKWVKTYQLEIDKEYKNSNKDIQSHIQKNAIKKLEQELKTLEKQLDSLHDLLEQGIYTVDKFLERSKTISERITTIQNEKDILIKNLNLQNEKDVVQKNIIPKIERVLDVYHKFDDPRIKNDLLKEVIEKAVYTKKVGGRWSNRINDFQIDLYPKLPRE